MYHVRTLRTCRDLVSFSANLQVMEHVHVVAYVLLVPPEAAKDRG